MPGPHPALRVLAALDAGAAFAVVGEALAGWDALASELREAAGLPPAPSTDAGGDCSATQACRHPFAFCFGRVLVGGSAAETRCAGLGAFLARLYPS